MSSQVLNIPANVDAWLTKAFTVVDSRDTDSGEQLAALFTTDASMDTPVGTKKGSAEIAASRSDAWDFVNSRKHTLLGVYTRTQDFSDIVVLGRLQMEFKNGAKVDSEFSAQIIFDIDGSGNVKAKSWKIFADTAPFIKAMTPA